MAADCGRLAARRSPVLSSDADSDHEQGRSPRSNRRAEVAQLVEHRPEEGGVVSSILTLGTSIAAHIGTGGSGSGGRAFPCSSGGRGLESRLPAPFLP